MCNGIRRANYLVATPPVYSSVNPSPESQSGSVSDGMSTATSNWGFLILDGIVLF